MSAKRVSKNLGGELKGPQVDTFDEVRFRYPFIGIGILVLGSIGVVWLLANWNEIREGFLPYRGTREQPFSLRQAPPLSVQPPLQVDEKADIDRYRNREKTILESYDWVDREKRVVRIPIQRAMDRLLEHGLPVKEAKP